MTQLYGPIVVGNTAIRNRIVVPPMVCFGWSDDTGIVSEAHKQHYEALARGGAGLIIVEATCVDPSGRLSLDQLGLWSDEHINGMKALTALCHQHGAKVMVQIHHAGEKRSKLLNEEAFDVNTLSAVTLKEIAETYAAAAKRAVEAGFDGIELHGAHGYLLCQMASPITNKRTDAYGGSLENRLRFAREVIEAVHNACPEGVGILGYRMGGNEPGLEEGIAIAKALESYGVMLLHVSAGITGEMTPEAPEDFAYNWIVYMGTVIKQRVNIPVIAVNGIRTGDEAARLVESELVDLVALGRAHLVDATWANTVKQGGTPISCLGCKPCKWFKDGRECPRRLSI